MTLRKAKKLNLGDLLFSTDAFFTLFSFLEGTICNAKEARRVHFSKRDNCDAYFTLWKILH